MIDARCRVTVIGAEKRVDLAIPAEAPIAEYNDLLARLCGQPEDDALPPVWSLAPIGAAPFALTSSLAAEGVEDGTVLYLRDTLADEEDEPVVHSVWELVAAHGETSGAVRWEARTVSRTVLLLGAFWLVASLYYLGLAGHRGPAVGIVAGVSAIGLAALARWLRPLPRVLPGRLRTVLACAAIPCAVAAAVLAPGVPALNLTHLIYFEIGLLVGLVIALVAVPDVLLGAITLFVAAGGVLMAIVIPLHATVTDIAATVAVVGVLFLAVAPRTAGLLVAASWLSMSSPTLEPDADPEQLPARVALAHRTVVLLVSLASAATGLALIVLSRSSGPFPLAVAVTAAIVLALRSGTFRLASEGVAPAIAAAAGVFGLLTMLARTGATAAYLMPTLLVVGVTAVVAGLPVLLWGVSRQPADDDKPSRLSAVQTMGQVTLPTLLLGVYGVFNTLWNVGR